METSTTRGTPSNRTSDRPGDTTNINHHHQHGCSLEGGDKNGWNCLDLLRCQWEAVSTRKWNRRMGELSNHGRGACHPWSTLTSSRSWPYQHRNQIGRPYTNQDNQRKIPNQGTLWNPSGHPQLNLLSLHLCFLVYFSQRQCCSGQSC